jgi:hypothetical protein
MCGVPKVKAALNNTVQQCCAVLALCWFSGHHQCCGVLCCAVLCVVCVLGAAAAQCLSTRSVTMCVYEWLEGRNTGEPSGEHCRRLLPGTAVSGYLLCWLCRSNSMHGPNQVDYACLGCSVPDRSLGLRPSRHVDVALAGPCCTALLLTWLLHMRRVPG